MPAQTTQPTFDQEEQDFLDDIATSCGRSDINQVAIDLDFNDAQAMADFYGFKNILTFFSAPDNHLRLLDTKVKLK